MVSEREANIMTLIYNKINDVIGAGNQLFTMQFPAQSLNANSFRYDTSERSSILTRPFFVAEQEFRLSDQLFDISPITAGSNGEKLSIAYKSIVNNLIPKLDYLAPFIRERAGLGRWLLEDSGEKDDTGNDLSRIELCKKLYQEYLIEKNKWNEEKNEKFESLRNKPGGIDEYAKWQSSYGMVRNEQLNNLYNDVVISGHLHEVLTILGYLNASSVAEELELGKQRMRNSARLSLDESLMVYPVHFSPNNWFKALRANLNPEDLTMTRESIRDIYLTKQKELTRAKGELKKTELITVTQEEIDDVQGKVDNAKKIVNEKESELISKYGESIVGIAKIYFNTFNIAGAVSTTINSAKAQGIGVNPNVAKLDAFKQAVRGVSETYQAQQELNSALSNYTSLMAKKAELGSRDWKLNIESIKQRVQELEVDVDYYANLLSEVSRQVYQSTHIELTRQSYTNKTLVYQLGILETVAGGSFTISLGKDTTPAINVNRLAGRDVIDHAALKTNLENVGKGTLKFEVTEVDNSPGFYILTFKNQDQEQDVVVSQKNLKPELNIKDPALLTPPQSEEEAELASMFTDITLKITDSSDSTSENSASKAESSSWKVSAWFASVGGNSSSSSASNEQKSAFFDQEIEIGFRVAKVTFDRGGWFNPNLFKMSKAFTRLAKEIKIAPGLTIDDIKEKSQSELSKYNNEYLLSSFPVAMAIVKDVTIKVKKSNMSSAAAKSVIENTSAVSGGFLGFSASRASSSKNSSESVMHGSQGEYYYIRIPGPQIIGYFLQFVSKDETEEYQPIAKGDKNEVIEALKEFNIDLLESSEQILSQVKEGLVVSTNDDESIQNNK
ncbi:MAG TPA: hypothetical protein DCS93_19420 [Microscillaceae bacterium]|nr:hypothetical protein [Microscillaceae bacterium]